MTILTLRAAVSCALRRVRVARRALLLVAALSPAAYSSYAQISETQLVERYRQEVDRRLEVPGDEQIRYATLLRETLTEQGLDALPPQYVVLVDRSEFVQAVMIFLKLEDGEWHFIGAAPASTGKPGRFEHFETPTGVFDHTLGNLDFRAEGTVNELGIRGYGLKGLRVYDFGWVTVPRGWGNHTVGAMRLQLHATDPARLESLLGSAESKGCIRIPASLNRFIDHYGLLDALYEQAMAAGRTFWVLSPQREPTRWPGHFLVVVDTGRQTRSTWSPPPLRR